MLQTPVPPTTSTLRARKKSDHRSLEEDDNSVDESPDNNPMGDAFDDDLDLGDDRGKGGKSRRELPAGAVATLKAWLLSPEHFTHPYPTPQDQAMLMQQTGIDKKQLKNWFTNARRRIWKPMLKKQIEQGKISVTGASGVGGVTGLIMPTMPGAAAVASSLDNPHSIQAMRVHYQQAAAQQQPEQTQQQQQQAPTMDAYGNSIYTTTAANDPNIGQYYLSQPNEPSLQKNQLIGSASLATLPPVASIPSTSQLSKTDSHAVLMELFARDQDLVRQATESARLKAESKQQPQQQQQQGNTIGSSFQYCAPLYSSQHPMKAQNQNPLQSVPSLNSWPHFSSINSLNNLGTMPGVKSIASLSGADLASKGNLNKMGNLAQVKSMESMGKNDSYAFLEVFFGDRSSTNLSGMAGGGSGSQKGMKSAGDEDNEIGLSLEDESPQQPIKREFSDPLPMPAAPQLAMMTSMPQDSVLDSGTLKRAYDDALAARGLISVSRSSERLTDLVLPAKIQRTLSQEFINKDQSSYAQYSYSSAVVSNEKNTSLSHQYPGQQPVEPPGSSSFLSDTQEVSNRVQVPTGTVCALCQQTNVDTQLRPCGHMFHERCLKPSLQNPSCAPKCPIDDIAMNSAVLAVPTDDTTPQTQPSNARMSSMTWTYSSTTSVPAENRGI